MNDREIIRQLDNVNKSVEILKDTLKKRIALPWQDVAIPNVELVIAATPFNNINFDIKPAAGYFGSPKAWREEMKPMIDFLSQKINNANYTNGMINKVKSEALTFHIMGNPLDTMLLSNIDWMNNDGTIGTFSGARRYFVTPSMVIKPGIIYIVGSSSTTPDINKVSTLTILNNENFEHWVSPPE